MLLKIGQNQVVQQKKNITESYYGLVRQKDRICMKTIKTQVTWSIFG
jgi:hypothetical protein